MRILDSRIIRLMSTPLATLRTQDEGDIPKEMALIVASPPEKEAPFSLNTILYQADVILTTQKWVTSGSALLKMDISDEMPCSSPRDAMNHRYAQLCEKYASSAVEILGDMLTRSFGVLDGLLKTGVTNQHKKIKFDIYIPSGNRETPAGS